LVIILLFDTDFEEEVSVITTVKQRGEAPFGRRFNVGPREAISYRSSYEEASEFCKKEREGRKKEKDVRKKREKNEV
jgi:hypothetical protein